MRDDFTIKTKDILAKRVGFRCSNPNCRKLTSGPSTDSEKSINIGVAAHISAASIGGPRFDSNQTTDQRKHIENGIWLCQSCSKLIDSDELRFPKMLLLKWKALSEESALYEVENMTIEEVEKLVKDINIISINQSGGQTAHTIINQKPVSRRISSGDAKIIEDLLRTNTNCPNFVIRLANGDPEADTIARQIKSILINSGWKEKGFLFKLAGSYPAGIEIGEGKKISEGARMLADGLYKIAKLEVRGKKFNEDPTEDVFITVGPNPNNYSNI